MADDYEVRGWDDEVETRGWDDEPEGGLLASAKQTIGSTIKGVGRAASDYIPGVSADNPVTRYGQEIVDANPTAVHSLSDIAEKPGTAITEAVGNAAPPMAGMVGARALGMGITAAAPFTGPLAPAVAAVGQGIAWLGPPAIAALPSYSGIRDKQILNDPANEADAKAKAVAALGAGAVGLIENKFGPQEWALSAMTKEGRAQLAKKFAAATLTGSIAKGGARGAIVEGSEELVQNPIEQAAAFDNPLTPENLRDTAFSGAMGAIGGGVLGGGAGASFRASQAPAPKPIEQVAAEVMQSPDLDSAINAAEAAINAPVPAVGQPTPEVSTSEQAPEVGTIAPNVGMPELSAPTTAYSEPVGAPITGEPVIVGGVDYGRMADMTEKQLEAISRLARGGNREAAAAELERRAATVNQEEPRADQVPQDVGLAAPAVAPDQEPAPVDVAPVPAAVEAPIPAAVAAPAPVSEAAPVGTSPGDQLPNGFRVGPQQGEKFRVGQVAAMGGGVQLEKRLPAGTVASFFVKKDGTLFEPSVNRAEDRSAIWVPETAERGKQAESILNEMGALALTDPRRAEAKARLKALVTSAPVVEKAAIVAGNATVAPAQPNRTGPNALSGDYLGQIVDAGNNAEATNERAVEVPERTADTAAGPTDADGVPQGPEAAVPGAEEEGTAQAQGPVAFKDFTAPKAIKNADGKVIVRKDEVRTFKTEKQAQAYSKSNALKGYVPRETSDGWVLSKSDREQNDFATRMAEQRAQEDALGARLSEMSGEEIEAEYQSIKTANDAVERAAIKKFLGPKKLAEYDAITGRRRKDAWLEKNITNDAQDYMNERMQPEAFAEQFRGAAGAFDETSPKALGESIAVLSKDVDKPGFMASPKGVTFKAALRYAMEQGWSMDDVLSGMRARASRWAGDDAQELFSRLFKRSDGKPPVIAKQPRAEIQPGQAALTVQSESEIRADEALAKKSADEKAKRDNAPSADGFVLTGSSRMVDEAEARGQGPLFSRAEPVSLGEFWQDYASGDTAFQYGKSDSSDIEQIAKDYQADSSKWRVEKTQRSQRVPGSFDPEMVEIINIDAKDGDGRFRPFLEVHPDPAGDPNAVFIRINETGSWPKRMDGALAYQMAMAWTANNGLKLNPDTDLLPVNRLRRTEAMISAMLKYGEKAGQIRPHHEQYVGLLDEADWNSIQKGGVDGYSATFPAGVKKTLERLRDALWVDPEKGATKAEKSDIFRRNLEGLLIASSELARRRVPALNELKVNDAGEIENTVTGERSNLRRTADMGVLGLPASALERGVGRTTGLRVVATLSIQRGFHPTASDILGAPSGKQRLPDAEGGDGVLAQGLGGRLQVDPSQARVLAAALGEKALYSREAPREFRRTLAMESGIAVKEAQAVLDSLGVEGEAVESPDDLPKNLLRQIESKGAKGDVRGVFDPSTGKIYVIASRVENRDLAAFVALHESAHRGLRRLFGVELDPTLRDIYNTNSNVKTKANVLRSKHDLSIEEATEEVIADLAKRGQAQKLVGWDKFVAFIKKWLANRGFKVEWTDTMVEVLAGAAAEVGKKGPTVFTGEDAKRLNLGATKEKDAEDGPRLSRGRPKWVENGSAELKSAASKIDTYAPNKSFKEKFAELQKNWADRAIQEVFDPYIALKKLTPNGYILARMVKSADTSLEAALRFGKPRLADDGSIVGDLDMKGFLGHMSELNGEHDRFFMWVAGNRSERLMLEGREHLFSADEIKAMKNLIREQGPNDKWKGAGSRPQAYAKAAEALRAYNRAFMDIAEKTGEINHESRVLWEHDFYIPFFRVDEDMTIQGPSRVKGLVRNEVLKKLKGGTEPLGDLLDNTIRNWQHVLSASLANQAAKTALNAAVDAGIAVEADEATAKQLEKAGKPTAGATYVMDDGERHWYTVGDPFVLEAISALETPSINWAGMKLLRQAKRVLTTGVTAAPPFRIRNLIRDSSTAVAQNQMSYNLVKNVWEGYKHTNPESATYAQAMFGGGIIRFGNIDDGKHAEHAKRLILDGVEDRTILDTPTKVRDALSKWWDVYQENGDRFENVNRMSLIEQRKAAGATNLEAMFAGRDSMDFTLMGANKGIRFLAQVVPFLNARLQGLYKTGRAVREDPKRIGYVTGALTLASIALMLAYRDDDEWKKRADWDRDTYFWFKIGDVAFRIPKGFELGGLATLAERGLELLISDEMNGKRFAERLWYFVGNTLSLNPIPQLAKPMVDLYANTDSFTGRQIETRGMENQSKPERVSRRTTLVAKTLGKAGNVTQLSPVQIDHLIQAYFGWLGTHAAMTVDVMAEPFLEVPKPARKIGDVFVVGDFVKDLPSSQSRYVEDFYKQAKKVHEVMGDLKQARDTRDAAKVQQILEDKRDEVSLRSLYSSAERTMTDINRKIRVIERSTASSDEKRARIDELNERKNRLAAVIARRTRERKAATQ